MATAPTYVTVVNNTTYGSYAASKDVTITSPQTGDTVIVCAYTADETTTLGTPTGGSLTYTERVKVEGVSSRCNIYMWTTETTSTSNLTVTVAATAGSDHWGLSAIVVRGSAGYGASVTANGLNTLPHTTMAYQSPNSFTVLLNADYDATGGSTTWETINGLAPASRYSQASANYRFYLYSRGDSGAADTENIGMTSPTGQTYSLGALEVFGTGSDVPITMVVADASHGHAVDNVALEEGSSGTDLTVADSGHAHAADGVTLTQGHTLAVADATHGHAAENVTFPGAGSGISWPADLVSFWDFNESSAPFVSVDGDVHTLSDGSGASVTTAADGPFGNAAVFDGSTDFLTLANGSLGSLDVANSTGEVTVCAWVLWDADQNSFIAGIWGETDGQDAREYGLFMNLPTIGGDNRVLGHVSFTGGDSPGYSYAVDASATARQVMPSAGWRFVAFTYDGAQSVAYLDGVADYLPGSAGNAANPYAFTDGLNPDSNAPFTVGACEVAGSMSNKFTGRIGGLAVFDRALTPDEVMAVHLATNPHDTEPIIRFPFEYPGTGTQLSPQAHGWRSVHGASATEASSTDTRNFGVTYVSGFRYLFRNSTTGATENTTRAGFGWFDHVDGVNLSQLDRVTFRLNNSHTGDLIRLAVRVGSTWYATDTEYGMGAAGATGSSWATTAEDKEFTVTLAAAAWRDLTVTPGTALTLGSSRGTDVTDGQVTGVGFYSPALVDNASNVRVDDLELWVSTDVDLVVSDAGHGHTVDGAPLTQVHELTVTDSGHGHAADAPTLTQAHAVTVADATHGHAADTPALTQVHELAVQDATHAHTADTPTVGDEVTLTVQGATHAHTVDATTLAVTITLALASTLHAHTVDTPTLTQAHTLTLASALHAHRADSATFAGAARDITLTATGPRGRQWNPTGPRGRRWAPTGPRS